MHIKGINKEYHRNTSPLQQLSKRLNYVIGGFTGCCIGYCGYAYYAYQMDPAQYAGYSAPWYTNSLIYCGVSAVAVGVALLLKWGIRVYTKQKNNKSTPPDAG